MAKYAMNREVDGKFEDTLERVKAALAEQGFGVLTEIDVTSTLKKKLDLDFRKYRILGACNPPFAHQALEAELDLGVLLPCNVALWETDAGKTMISAMDPEAAMGGLVEAPQVKEIASQVRARILAAVESV